jgi:ketosteroid isomerase-like protein
MTDPIQEQYRTFMGAMRAGNVSELVSLLSDDAVLMPPADRTLSGKAEIREWYGEYFEYFYILHLEETDRVVSTVGDTLVERIAVNVKLEARKGGMPIYDDARLLNVWRRDEDGSWKLWQSMWNSVKPIGAGTNRFLVRFMQGRDE